MELLIEMESNIRAIKEATELDGVAGGTKKNQIFPNFSKIEIFIFGNYFPEGKFFLTLSLSSFYKIMEASCRASGTYCLSSLPSPLCSIFPPSPFPSFPSSLLFSLPP
jgi:hypothetical protein